MRNYILLCYLLKVLRSFHFYCYQVLEAVYTNWRDNRSSSDKPIWAIELQSWSSDSRPNFGRRRGKWFAQRQSWRLCKETQRSWEEDYIRWIWRKAAWIFHHWSQLRSSKSLDANHQKVHRWKFWLRLSLQNEVLFLYFEWWVNLTL